MRIKYSIITANYNGFELMNKYFISLENQTYKNFEIIIIDDSSTDDSLKKLIDFSKESKLDIKIFNTPENSGPGVARNIGIENAKGDYITFIDNDDWVESNLFERITDIIDKNRYDCLIYNYYLDSTRNQIKSKSVYKDIAGEITKSDALKYTRNHTVCKVYNRRIFINQDIRFPNIRRHEDIAFVGTALINCQSFYYLDDYLYHYVQYKSSLSSDKSKDETTLIKAFEILKKNFNDSYKLELINKSVTDLLYGSILIMCKNNKSKKEIIKFIDEYEKNYQNWYNSEIINYVGKTKKIFFFLVKHKQIFMLKIFAKIHSILLK